MEAASKAADIPNVAHLKEPVAASGSSHATATAAKHPSPIHPEAAPNSDPPDRADPAQAQEGGEEPSIHVPLSPTDPAVAATIPAVLAEMGTESGLSEAELAGVAKLTEEFVGKVTGGSQDPRDPAHQQRWDEAQAESDAQMRARYGGHAWLKHHQEAYRQALENTPNQRGPGK